MVIALLLIIAAVLLFGSASVWGFLVGAVQTALFLVVATYILATYGTDAVLAAVGVIAVLAIAVFLLKTPAKEEKSSVPSWEERHKKAVADLERRREEYERTGQ